MLRMSGPYPLVSLCASPVQPSCCTCMPPERFKLFRGKCPSLTEVRTDANTTTLLHGTQRNHHHVSRCIMSGREKLTSRHQCYTSDSSCILDNKTTDKLVAVQRMQGGTLTQFSHVNALLVRALPCKRGVWSRSSTYHARSK